MRTPGSISLIQISYADLCRVLGFPKPTDEQSGRQIVISKKWLDQQQKPCEMVCIKQDELDRLNSGLGERVLPIETSHATPSAIAPRRAQATEIDFEIEM